MLFFYILLVFGANSVYINCEEEYYNFNLNQKNFSGNQMFDASETILWDREKVANFVEKTARNYTRLVKCDKSDLQETKINDNSNGYLSDFNEIINLINNNTGPNKEYTYNKIVEALRQTLIYRSKKHFICTKILLIFVNFFDRYKILNIRVNDGNKFKFSTQLFTCRKLITEDTIKFIYDLIEKSKIIQQDKALLVSIKNETNEYFFEKKDEYYKLICDSICVLLSKMTNFLKNIEIPKLNFNNIQFHDSKEAQNQKIKSIQFIDTKTSNFNVGILFSCLSKAIENLQYNAEKKSNQRFILYFYLDIKKNLYELLDSVFLKNNCKEKNTDNKIEFESANQTLDIIFGTNEILMNEFLILITILKNLNKKNSGNFFLFT